MLLTILAYFIKSKDGILLLEEPENHMHPGYINLLVKHLVDYYKKFNVQIFISTHSLDLIDAFIEYLKNKPGVQKDFQIIRLYKIDEKIEKDVLTYDQAREAYEDLKIDLRGIWR